MLRTSSATAPPAASSPCRRRPDESDPTYRRQRPRACRAPPRRPLNGSRALSASSSRPRWQTTGRGPAKSLATVGQRRIEIERRQAPPVAVKVAVHVRDSWTCRYCCARTIHRRCSGSSRRFTPTSSRTTRTGRQGRSTPPTRSCPRALITSSRALAAGAARSGQPRNRWPAAQTPGKADLRLGRGRMGAPQRSDVRSHWDGLTGSTDALWERAAAPISTEFGAGLRVAPVRGFSPYRSGRRATHEASSTW